MNIFENIVKLCEIKHVKYTTVEKELWGTTGVMVKWKDSYPRFDKIYEVARYFNVPMEYFMTGNLPQFDAREDALLRVFRSCDEIGKMKIDHILMTEFENTQEREKTETGRASDSAAG